MTVETMFADIYENIHKGFFTFQKSENQYSQIALDQVHEQNNHPIKSSGGVTDLISKFEESALIRWEMWPRNCTNHQRIRRINETRNA